MKKSFALIAVLLVVAITFSFAQEEKADKAKADPKEELNKSVERGKALFMDPSLGSTDMSCNSCHMEGGKKEGKMGEMAIKPFTHIASKYPKYFEMAGKVMTLDQVNNWCIVNPMKGKPLAWDDQRLADLTAYIASVNAMKHEKPEKP